MNTCAKNNRLKNKRNFSKNNLKRSHFGNLSMNRIATRAVEYLRVIYIYSFKHFFLNFRILKVTTQPATDTTF